MARLQVVVMGALGCELGGLARLESGKLGVALEPCIPASDEWWAFALTNEDAMEMGAGNPQFLCGNGRTRETDMAAFGLVGCGGGHGFGDCVREAFGVRLRCVAASVAATRGELEHF